MAVASVGDSASSVALLAPNPALEGAAITNTSSAVLYVLVGQGTASATNHSFQLQTGDYWESPSPHVARGGLTGIWASDAGGLALVTTW